MKRQRCFMEVSFGAGQQGRIEFELFNDIVPKTVENFRALCTGYQDESGVILSYKGTIFHRVVNNYIVQGGRVSTDGSDGQSIYGTYFDDEDLDTPHDQPFLLSMANKGPNTNGSQFFITTSSAPHLDKLHVVFGKVASGQKVVKMIEALDVDRNHRPLEDVRVTRCGELVFKSSSKKEKKKKRSHSVDARDSVQLGGNGDDQPSKKRGTSEDEELGESHPLASTTDIRLEDIPNVPINKYLLRHDGNQDAPSRHESSRERNYNSNRRDGDRERTRRASLTKSGRKIKGRGVFRYRTPSPPGRHDFADRRRSVTPPHWRLAQHRVIKLTELKKRNSEREERQKASALQSEQKETSTRESAQKSPSPPMIRSEVTRQERKKEEKPRERRHKKHSSPESGEEPHSPDAVSPQKRGKKRH